MHRLKIGKKGLEEAVKIEKGIDMVAGYVEKVQKIEIVINQLLSMTEEERMEVFDNFCIHCGGLIAMQLYE